MESKIEGLVVNTENGSSYAYVLGKKRLIGMISGKYIDKGYANVFNEVDQLKVGEFLHS